jgi:hypothetical protein
VGAKGAPGFENGSAAGQVYTGVVAQTVFAPTYGRKTFKGLSDVYWLLKSSVRFPLFVGNFP